MATNHTFKRLKAVTLGVLKFAKGQPRFLAILSPMYLGKKIPGKNKGAPTMVQAVDMETGEVGVVLCPTIMQKELAGAYPKAGYVRKGFEIMVTRDPEKGYNYVSISEVAPPDDFEFPDLGMPDSSSLMSDDVLLAGKPRGEGDEDEDDEPEAPPARATPAKKTAAKARR